MLSRSRIRLAALGAFTALALAAAPASATSVQTSADEAYQGPLTATLAPASTITFAATGSDFGAVNCNQSTLGGQVSNAGGAGQDATANFSSASFTHNGGAACESSFNGLNSSSVVAPSIEINRWSAEISWIDDNTAGTPNATLKLSNAAITLNFFGGSCTYLNGSSFEDLSVDLDLYNPDNTASGMAELRFVNEPFLRIVGSCGSEPILVTGTYSLTGTGGIDLEVRESPPSGTAAPTCQDVSRSTAYTVPVAVSLNCAGVGPLSYAIVDEPDNGSITGDPSDGGFTYTPDDGFSGTETFTYKATNAGGDSNVSTVTVQVADPLLGFLETADGQPYTGSLDGVLSSLTFSMSTGIGDVTCNESSFTGEATTSGSVNNPAAWNIGGINWFENGSQACADNMSEWNVTDIAPNSLPWNGKFDWIDDNTSGTPNATTSFVAVRIQGYITYYSHPYNQAVCEFVSDGDGQRLTLDFYNSDNTASGDAEIRFVAEPFREESGGCTSGADVGGVYRLTGRDGLDLAVRGEQSVAVPDCLDVESSTSFETPVPVSLDCLGTGTLGYEIVSGPSDGTISGDPSDGDLTYTPASGFSGTDTFTYRASNAQGDSETATVTVVVDPPPPTCQDVGLSTGFQQPVEITLACVDGPLTFSAPVGPGPSGGTISGDPSDGTFTYTPSPGFTGTDSFKYTASNAEGTSNQATVTIQVGAPPAAPPAVNTPPSDTAGQTGSGAKCKKPKGKKSAASAKKRCKKKGK